MKRAAGPIAAASLLAAILGTSAVFAEPTQTATPSQTTDWSGYYVGLSAAQPTGDNYWDRPALGDHSTLSDDWSGTLPILTVGRDWQRGQLTFGAAFSLSGGEITAAPQPGIFLLCNDCDTIVSDLMTLRGRAGLAAGKMHYFVTGGFARADVAGTSGGGQTTVNSDTLTGWTLGLGVERHLGEKLSLTAGYDRTDLGAITLERHNPGAISEIKFGLMQIGVNYRW
jgi:opacity protein-like surface antigen